MRQFKLAVLRAVHDGTTPADTDFVNFVMTDPLSVLNYWSQVTDGWFDFSDSAVFPWVKITVAPTAVDRWSTAAAAMAAVRSANPGQDPLAGFDGVLVLLHPGVGVDGGSGELGDMPFSTIPTTPSDHTFVCHELGHTLGAEHTFGLLCSGIDYKHSGAVGPEYGSPYDLMSSASFGTRADIPNHTTIYAAQPTFLGPATGPSSTFWVGTNSLGPALSRANLHRWFPEAIATSTHEAPFPDPGTAQRYRIARAPSSGTTLLILHPADEAANGVGRVYVEYRTSEGWDRGLGQPGAGLARPGVVVHTLEDASEGPRVWYRGSIVDNDPDTDLRLDTRPLVITVSNRGADGEHWVELNVATTASPTVTLTVENRDAVDHGDVTETRQTPCGDNVEIGTWYTVTTGVCRVATTGLEPDVTAPAVSVHWSLGGSPVPEGATTMTVPSVDGTMRQVACSLDAVTHELAVGSLAGETYTIEVRASVATSAPGAGTPARLEGAGTFTPPGSFAGFSPDAIVALGRCAAQNALVMELPKVIDVASLLDHHEVWQWQADATKLQEQLAAGTGPLVTEFQQGMGVETNGFEVPTWQRPDLIVFPG